MKNLIHSNNSNHILLHSHNHLSPVNDYLLMIKRYFNRYSNYLLLERIKKHIPIVGYDYKRLPMLFFNEIMKLFKEQQENTYLTNPPHYKVTEALTQRLSSGQTSYNGAIHLKPVDNLYTIMLDKLYSFIMNPKQINFTKKESDNRDYKNRLLDRLKEFDKILIPYQSYITNPIVEHWSTISFCSY